MTIERTKLRSLAGHLREHVIGPGGSNFEASYDKGTHDEK